MISLHISNKQAYRRNTPARLLGLPDEALNVKPESNSESYSDMIWLFDESLQSFINREQ